MKISSCSRAFADDQVELVILHRGIEDFLDRRIEPVDFINEEHVTLLEIGEQGREITRLGDDGPGGRSEIDPQFLRHDLGKRRLAEPGRPGKEHMVERLVARLCGIDEHFEIGLGPFLAEELGKALRP